MNVHTVQQRLIEAETKLSRALQRLHVLRRAALYGNYDPVEFDRAVMSYREAEAEVRSAREAWADLHQDGPLPIPPIPREEVDPEPVSVPQSFQSTAPTYEESPNERAHRLVATGDVNGVQQWLGEAETALSHTLQKLYALRRAAIYGNYDPVEFDKAVQAYRNAEAVVAVVRQAWADVQTAPPRAAQPVSPKDSESTPIEVTPRLRFIRWLVETGRLNDFDDGGVDELYQTSTRP